MTNLTIWAIVVAACCVGGMCVYVAIGPGYLNGFLMGLALGSAVTGYWFTLIQRHAHKPRPTDDLVDSRAPRE
jgi:hypothetical protein